MQIVHKMFEFVRLLNACQYAIIVIVINTTTQLVNEHIFIENNENLVKIWKNQQMYVHDLLILPNFH